MPVKNAGSYLKPCLDSILAQTYTEWELVAINDCSTDGSDSVLRQYSDNHKNIVVADSEGVGIISALRMAYSLCSGVLIHRMDADDLMPTQKLEWMTNAAEKGAIVTGKVSYFCDEREVGDGFLNYTDWLNNLMERVDFWIDVYRECPVPSSAWMMYRTDFERIGGFSSDLMPEDYDLAFRMLKHKLKVIRLNPVIHHWRDSETRTSRNQQQYFPLAYLPLKVHYFLELQRDCSKPLVLWGAGKKGKCVAKELVKNKVDFTWITNNDKKVGNDIYGIKLKRDTGGFSDNTQLIIALSSPEDKCNTQIVLEELEKINNRDYFWFF